MSRKVNVITSSASFVSKIIIIFKKKQAEKLYVPASSDFFSVMFSLSRPWLTR